MAGSRFLHWLQWLARGRGATDPSSTSSAPAPPQTTAPLSTNEPDDEARLSTYLRRIGILDERPQKADAAELAALTRLWDAGATTAATRLGGALAAALPHDDALQLLVADMLFRQRLGDAAQPLLKRVLAKTETTADGQAQKQRARWLLAEIAAAAGQTTAACNHLAELLAEDFHFPGARERLHALRGLSDGLAGGLAASERPMNATAATLGAATAAAPTLLGTATTTATRYRLRTELGCGGNGTVYLVDDAELGCAVALKLFHPHRSRKTSPQPALREARLLSSLRHPGVLFLYELDEAGRYLTMELCSGGSLRARLQNGPLPPRLALTRAIELCDTLRAVHALSIVHGDVKPENLLFREPVRSQLAPTIDPPYGDLVLGDFGVGIEVSSATNHEAGAGTRGYLSPERLRGAPPSAAADLYAFGIVIGELFGPAIAQASPALRSLVEKLGAQDPAARPDANAALSTLRAIASATENS